MKKICFICGNICNSGGTEKIVSLIANKLCENKNYSISIFSLNGKTEDIFFDFDKSIKIDFLKNKKNKILKIMNKFIGVYKYIKENNIDIIIDVDVDLDIYSIPAKKLTKSKLISWDHFSFNNDKNSYSARLYKVRKLTSKFSDLIVVLNSSYKEKYNELYNCHSKIEVIKNPVEIDKNLKYNTEAKTLVTIGNYLPVKGFDRIPEISKEVFKKNKDWNWIIIGDGENRKNIQEKINEYNLSDNVKLIGRVKNIKQKLLETSIYVLPSRDESFGLVLLEALNNKLPLVAFETDGSNEIVEDNINGYIIEQGNIKEMAKKINYLIETKEKREKMSNNSIISLKKYDIENIIKQWEKVLKNI